MLIYRQAAIDAMMRLQAEDDENYGCHIPEGFDGERAKEALKELPSAEIDVIRCKDCRHFNEDVIFGRHTCPMNNAIEVGYDDYCSRAEQ